MPTKRRRARQRTLAIDVGGSGVKCALLDARGRMASEKLREDTPERFTPAQLLALIERMAAQMPRYDRVAVGIPGIVHRDIVYSLPASKSRAFKRFELGARLADRLGARTRVTNDAAMHVLAAIRGPSDGGRSTVGHLFRAVISDERRKRELFCAHARRRASRRDQTPAMRQSYRCLSVHRRSFELFRFPGAERRR